jgi:hypothetical protein
MSGEITFATLQCLFIEENIQVRIERTYRIYSYFIRFGDIVTVRSSILQKAIKIGKNYKCKSISYLIGSVLHLLPLWIQCRVLASCPHIYTGTTTTKQAGTAPMWFAFLFSFCSMNVSWQEQIVKTFIPGQRILTSWNW